MAYSKGVIKQTSGREYISARDLFEQSGAIKEIDKVFQQANRRIQNLQKSGNVSPALMKLEMERGVARFSYFSRANLSLNNITQKKLLEYEYNRAISFLKNPTSTSTGARQYTKMHSEKMHLSYDRTKQLLPKIINAQGRSGAYKYRETVEEYESDIEFMEDNQSPDITYEVYWSDLEKQLDAMQTKMNNATDNFLDMLGGFKTF